jgi:hypothetical protein
MSTKRALIIATPFALASQKSGASIRLFTISEILTKANFNVTKISSADFAQLQNLNWDLIVLVSFSTAKSLSKAYRESKLLWFDATDSWHTSRISRFWKGEILQIFALCRDKIRVSTVNKIDLITFISAKDAEREIAYSRRVNAKVFVVPNVFHKININPGEETRYVFVADGRYGPNKKAIKFLESTTKFLPANSKIFLVGRELKSKSNAIVSLGYVPDNRLYFSRDIHLAPISSGAGIKNKVAEPLSLGLTVITTKHGANGLKKLSNLIIGGSPKSFAVEILKINSFNLKSKYGSVYLVDETSKLMEFLKRQIIKMQT